MNGQPQEQPDEDDLADSAGARDAAVVPRLTHGVESPRRVLRILLSFSETKPYATVQELADEVRVPVSTAYRYVSLLRELGVLEEAPGGSYRVTPRIIPVARAAAAANSIVDVARPMMQQLAARFDETVMLMRVIGMSAVCIDRVEPSRPVRLSFEPGHPLPLHSGASGKTLLAFLPAREREAFLTQLAADPQLAERSEQLEAELEEIAGQGWGTSLGEVDDGMWACSAIVNPGTASLAALSVAGPAYRIDAKAREAIARSLRDSAAELGRALLDYDHRSWVGSSGDPVDTRAADY